MNEKKSKLGRSNIPIGIKNRMIQIHNYIKYCKRLEEAYRTKHEEVKTLNEYLKRIKNVIPRNINNCHEVNDIIKYIDSLPEIPETDELNETLRKMINQQKKWEDENLKNYNFINEKIDNISNSNGNINNFIDNKMEELVIDGVKIIPFSRNNIQINKYGGEFLNRYFYINNPILLTFDSIGTKKFWNIETAFLSHKSDYIQNKLKREAYLNSLSKAKSIKEVNSIKNKFNNLIKNNKKFNSEWNKNRLNIMKNILKSKFELNPDLAIKLKNTGGSYLLEQSRKDNNLFWSNSISDNKKFIGSNMMGKLIMDIRKELYGNKNPYQSVNIGRVKNYLNKTKIKTNKIQKKYRKNTEKYRKIQKKDRKNTEKYRKKTENNR